MATVGQPRYGVDITYTNGAKTKMWFNSEKARDSKHAKLQKDRTVRSAKRIVR